MMAQPATTGRVEVGFEIEIAAGPSHSTAEGAELAPVSGDRTGSLRPLTATWEDIQKTRLAAAQRGQDDLAEVLKKQEERYSRLIRRELEQHVIWPWLSQFPGLGGVHTARLIGMIGEPRRFPGQRCDKGHYSAPLYAVGAVCPYNTIDGPCDGIMLPRRTTTGTRSLWHWAGLAPGARRKKGQRADFNPVVKTIVLMPGGIAEQIVRLRVPHYRDIYDATKERLSRERAVEVAEIGHGRGPLPIHPAEAEVHCASDPDTGLRPFQIDAIARKVAAKAFLGDLLAEWKRVVADRDRESDVLHGDDVHIGEAA